MGLFSKLFGLKVRCPECGTPGAKDGFTGVPSGMLPKATFVTLTVSSSIDDGAVDPRGPIATRIYCAGYLQSLRPMVIHLVPAKFLLEFRELATLVDQHILDARHLGKVLHMLGSERHTEASVMRAASQNPGCRSDFEIGLGNPHSSRDRQFGQRLVGWDDIYGVDDQAEAVAKVND